MRHREGQLHVVSVWGLPRAAAKGRSRVPPPLWSTVAGAVGHAGVSSHPPRGRGGAPTLPTLAGTNTNKWCSKWSPGTSNNVSKRTSESFFPFSPSPLSLYPPPFTAAAAAARLMMHVRVRTVAGIFGMDCRFKSVGRRVISRFTLIENFRLECLMSEKGTLSI